MPNLTLRTAARRTGLIALVVLIVCGFMCRPATAVTLDIDVLSPMPPVTDLDAIQLRALTSQPVLPDTTWQTYTSGLVINGFDITWELTSGSVGGVGLQIIIPVAMVETIGPLPAGTYNVTATWVGAAPIWSQHLLPLVGTTQFAHLVCYGGNYLHTGHASTTLTRHR
jgi:hypothetical protein